jgi:hypothetical protein
MRNKSLIRIVALLALAALAVPAFAKPVSRNLSLSHPAKLGQAQLEAGDYRVLIDGTEVTVKRFNKVVAEVDGTWEQRPEKSPYNSFLINRYGQLEEIRFKNDDRVLVLHNQ